MSRVFLTPELQQRALEEVRRRTGGRRGAAKRVAHETGVNVGTIHGVLRGDQKADLKLALGLGLVAIVDRAAAAAPGEGLPSWLPDQSGDPDDQLQLELGA